MLRALQNKFMMNLWRNRLKKLKKAKERKRKKL
jgi:hypothetical protein